MTHQTAPLPFPARWYYGWNIVAVCVVSQVSALALTLNCFSLFLHDWTHAFAVPVSLLTLSITIFSAGCALFAPFAGLAADRYPARWVFGLALAVLALFHLAVSFVTAGWQIVALYSLMLPAAVTFSASITASTVVSRWFVRRVGLAMGLSAFGLALAGVIFPSLVVWLLPIMGWRGVWRLFAAVIALIALPIVVGVLRDRPTPDEGRHYLVGGPAVDHGPRLTAREVFRRPNFWVVVCVFVPVQCAYMGVGINLAPLVTSHGFGVKTAGILISAMSLSALVAKLAAGAAADRLGNKAPLIASALFSAAGVMLLAVSARQLPVVVGALVLMGLSQGVWTLVASATSAEFGARGFGRAFGFIGSAAPLGSLAPPILARLHEVSGSYTAGLVGLGVLALCGAAAGLALKEKVVR